MAGLTLTTDERLDALERRQRDLEFEVDCMRIRSEAAETELGELKNRKITLSDLPVHQLMDRLETLGFDAAELLHRGTVTPDLLAPAAA